MGILLVFCAAALYAEPVRVELPPGDHLRQMVVDGLDRSYLVHVPRSYDAKQPTPVVLAFHGAFMNAQVMASFSELNAKSEKQGFLVAYPNGTGPDPRVLFFNAGLFAGQLANELPDDVKFTATLLDDLARISHVDSKRVYATGMSNGGMMCYRLAAELSDRIAAIAPVAGTLALERYQPKRKVPVLHIHGTDDPIVPFDGPNGKLPGFIRFRSVADTMRQCSTANDCAETPNVTKLPDRFDDGTTVECRTYAPRMDGAEVLLYVITGGGHTWPGRERALGQGPIGLTSREISANDLMWEFFARHPLER